MENKISCTTAEVKFRAVRNVASIFRTFELRTPIASSSKIFSWAWRVSHPINTLANIGRKEPRECHNCFTGDPLLMFFGVSDESRNKVRRGPKTCWGRVRVRVTLEGVRGPAGVGLGLGLGWKESEDLLAGLKN